MDELTVEQAAAADAIKAKIITKCDAMGITPQQLIALLQELAPLIAAVLQLFFPTPAPTPTPTPGH